MKKSKQKKVRLNKIQQNKITGHPSLPFSQTRDNVKSIGFTHDKDESHGKKEKLRHNINPIDKSECYVKVTVEKQHAKDYEERDKYKNFRVHEDDKPIINRIIRKNKKDRH